MGWLYNKGLAKLSVFPYNNFFPDGTPMEATGGYNNIHSRIRNRNFRLWSVTRGCIV